MHPYVHLDTHNFKIREKVQFVDFSKTVLHFVKNGSSVISVALIEHISALKEVNYWAPIVVSRIHLK